MKSIWNLQKSHISQLLPHFSRLSSLGRRRRHFTRQLIRGKREPVGTWRESGRGLGPVGRERSNQLRTGSVSTVSPTESWDLKSNPNRGHQRSAAGMRSTYTRRSRAARDKAVSFFKKCWAVKGSGIARIGFGFGRERRGIGI